MFPWENKNVLVTGGAGLIGSYVVEELVSLGAYVTVVDDLSRGALSNLEGVRAKIEFDQADLRMFSIAMLACERQHVVIQLASPSYGVAYSMNHKGQMFTDTVRIGFNILDAARLQGVEKTLVVSSSCVYPDSAPVPTPEKWGTKRKPERSNEGYGWAKRMIERQASYYRRDYGMKIATARPFNTYGPRVPVFKDDRDHVIVALLVKALSTEGPLHVWGSGNQSRAFMHAKDVAHVLIQLAQYAHSPWPINVGSKVAVDMSTLAQMVLDVAGSPDRPIMFNTIREEGAFVKSALAPTMERILDRRREDPINLEDGLAEMCDYVKAQLAQGDQK